MQVYGLVTTGTTAPYYCSTTNNWTAFGSGGGGGSNPVGGLYAIQYYATSSTLGGSANATVDASGNETLAGTLSAKSGSFGSGTFAQLYYAPATISELPAANGSTCIDGTKSCTGVYIPVNDAISLTDCSVGGGTLNQYNHWCLSNGSTWAASNPPGTVTSVIVTGANGIGVSGCTITTSGTCALSLGALTPSSMIATGIHDGLTPVTVTTGSSATIGGTYSSGYVYNENATAAAAITYTLPTAVAGKQYCVANAYNGSAANTGTLELLTSASGQFIIFTDGTLSATGGYVISAGAARDAACVVGVDSTHWMLYTNSGTWGKH
jgi:hypothetical protein